jgi:hypothetical protein
MEAVLGTPLDVHWRPQSALPDTFFAEVHWTGNPHTADDLADRLGNTHCRFEILVDPTAGGLGRRYMYTPKLGFFQAATDEAGSILLDENRLRAALRQGDAGLSERVDELLGAPWDAELEPFREAEDDSSGRWLYLAV